MLEKQLADLQSEVDAYDKKNTEIEAEVKGLVENLSSATGLNLEDSLDQAPYDSYDSQAMGSRSYGSS